MHVNELPQEFRAVLVRNSPNKIHTARRRCEQSRYYSTCAPSAPQDDGDFQNVVRNVSSMVHVCVGVCVCVRARLGVPVGRSAVAQLST